MIRRPPRSTHCISSAASDVYKRQYQRRVHGGGMVEYQTRAIDPTQVAAPWTRVQEPRPFSSDRTDLSQAFIRVPRRRRAVAASGAGGAPGASTRRTPNPPGQGSRRRWIER
eukprot:TRINITY_DN22883_c0_g1_i1.p2 TRINITY_DN22883_c0_g1~~TRINITY_DN22883_c0_g1_i1.p2  ORF type:complete len:112 (+),score=10.06 TRINITY_DN22883_c0_g1_i1:144-479(+)